MNKNRYLTIASIAFVSRAIFGFAPGRCLGQDKKPAQPTPASAPAAQQPAALIPPLAVEVTNDASHPLPVAGSVNIAGTANVTVGNPVSIAGTPNVNVTNPVTLAPGANVNVSSSASNPIFVQQTGGSTNTTTLLLTALNVVVAGRNTDLGTIDASAYQQIRVSATDAFRDPTQPEHVYLILNFVENGQDIAGLEPLDVVSSPGGIDVPIPVSKIYDFPGKTLHVTALCTGPGKCGPISVVIYGR
jgi:hypothetical protein